MDEIKRKKPWEEEQSEGSVLGQTFLVQCVICMLIIGAVVFMSKTNMNPKFLTRINQEIVKQMNMDEWYQEAKEIKSTIINYVSSK